jgi:single-strand DNA-binding protein
LLPNFALPDKKTGFTVMNNLRNSVRLTGFLGAAPEIRVTSTDKKVATLNLATHFYHKDKKGETIKDTTWHQLVLWEKQADIAETYLDKGSEITVEGRLVNRFYTDKEGAKKRVTEVIVNEMMMLGKKRDN